MFLAKKDSFDSRLSISNLLNYNCNNITINYNINNSVNNNEKNTFLSERNIRTDDIILLNQDKINENNIFLNNQNINPNKQLSSTIFI